MSWQGCKAVTVFYNSLLGGLATNDELQRSMQTIVQKNGIDVDTTTEIWRSNEKNSCANCRAEHYVGVRIVVRAEECAEDGSDAETVAEMSCRNRAEELPNLI